MTRAKSTLSSFDVASSPGRFGLPSSGSMASTIPPGVFAATASMQAAGRMELLPPGAGAKLHGS